MNLNRNIGGPSNLSHTELIMWEAFLPACNIPLVSWPGRLVKAKTSLSSLKYSILNKISKPDGQFQETDGGCSPMGPVVIVPRMETTT